MTGSWAARDFVRPGGVYDGLHSGLTVASIMTPRDQLFTCALSEYAGDVRQRVPEDFDFIPVLEDGNEGPRFVGLLSASEIRGAPVSKRVKESFVPLDEKLVIAADATIREFVVSAKKHPCRLVISGSSVKGLVSLSDIQRLPVRAALFALVTGLEMALIDAIHRLTDSDVDWKSLLDQDRLKQIERIAKKSKKIDNVGDDLLFTNIVDKGFIFFQLQKRNAADIELIIGELKEIKHLRDKLAHAADYASSSKKASKICEITSNIAELLSMIAEVEFRA